MQDGKFQQGQLTHATGRGVFIFAGGTSECYEAFGPDRSNTEAYDAYRMRKGPDFHSRLDAYFDVLGPNPAKQRPGRPSDIGYPLRRALLIRSLLAGNSDKRLDIDPDLLDALLLAPKYKHGARSLEKLVQPLKSADFQIRRSALPPQAQLAMHVEDVEVFTILLERNTEYRRSPLIDSLASAVHETWRSAPPAPGDRAHLEHMFQALSPADKEDNRSAARRIPDILALVGLGIEPGIETSAETEAEVVRHIAHHVERLAEAEHEGWMAQRRRAGWRPGPYDPALRRHPMLVPYGELPAENKAKDRSQVLAYPAKVKAAEYRIVWLGQAEPQDPGDPRP
jgi:hypothetical protein